MKPFQFDEVPMRQSKSNDEYNDNEPGTGIHSGFTFKTISRTFVNSRIHQFNKLQPIRRRGRAYLPPTLRHDGKLWQLAVAHGETMSGRTRRTGRVIPAFIFSYLKINLIE
jgi:hypothetical protein